MVPVLINKGVFEPGYKESDTTEQLNWTDNDLKFTVQNRS